MHAVLLTGHGGYEALDYRTDVPVPQPKAGEVLIRVAATAVTRQGGRILLSANGGNIQSRGQLVARGTSGNGGQIKVSAGNGGRASISGRVDADGPDGAGGKVTIRPIAGTHRPVHPALHLLAPAALKDTKHLSQQRLHVLHAQTPCGRVRFLDGSVGRGGTRHRR